MKKGLHEVFINKPQTSQSQQIRAEWQDTWPDCAGRQDGPPLSPACRAPLPAAGKESHIQTVRLAVGSAYDEL